MNWSGNSICFRLCNPSLSAKRDDFGVGFEAVNFREKRLYWSDECFMIASIERNNKKCAGKNSRFQSYAVVEKYRYVISARAFMLINEISILLNVSRIVGIDGTYRMRKFILIIY